MRSGHPSRPPGLIRPHHSKLALLNRAADAACIWLGLWLALRVYGVEWTDLYSLAAALGMVFFTVFAEYRDVYRAWRGAQLVQEVGRLVTSWAGAAVVVIILAFAAKRASELSRVVMVLWFVAAPLLLAIWRVSMRLTLRTLRARGRNTRSVAVAGAGELGVRVFRNLLGNPWMGLKPVGFFDDHKQRGTRPLATDEAQVIGSLDDMVRLARAGAIDILYLALPMRAEKRMREVIDALADTAVSVYVVPDLFCFDLLNARMVSFAGIPAVSVFENPFDGVEGWVKRVEDVVLATLILAGVALPMLLIALAIKLTSPGPVIFRQRRYGLDGKEIIVWKFRTMTVCEDGDDFVQARQRDPRVTRLGAVLRRLSLDELPQFFNVLQGTMSVVGPRPHPVALNESHRGLIHGYMLRHKVKPGITGWAQINGFRGETEKLEKMQGRIEHDLWYIQNWSLWLDLKIVVTTVWRGFSGPNCY